MNTLEQTFENLIGSPNDIKKLENNKSARILMLSDSHGKPDLVKEIIMLYGPECDALTFCGDGALDLIKVLTEAKNNSKLLKAIPSVIAMVQGNGDNSQYSVEFGNNNLIIPARQILKVNRHKILIIHGHIEGINWGFDQCGLEAQIAGCNKIFYGHTHVAAIYNNGDYTFVNPGSCSRPRSGQPSCFAIATLTKDFADFAHIKIENGTNGQRKYSTFMPFYY